MEALLSRIARWQRIGLAGVAGLGGAILLAPSAYAPVTQELIALLGLLMAGVLPAMVLTASVLRPGNLSVKRLASYQSALSTQLKVWFGLFLVSFLCSGIVVLGKMIGWSLVIEVPTRVASHPIVGVELVRILNGLLSAGLVLLCLRVGSLGRGVLSLLRLTGEIAISEAQERDAYQHKEVRARLESLPDRDGFGSFVDVPLEPLPPH